MENEIEKSKNEGAVSKILDVLPEIANVVGGKLAGKISDFIDDCFDINKKE